MVINQSKSSFILEKSQLYGWLVIFFGFFGFFLWAAVYPIRQGVPASGYIVTEGKRIQIISPKSGLLDTISVHDGDEVIKGDELFAYDSTTQNANLRSLKEAVLGTEASSISLRNALNARNSQLEALRTQHEASLKLLQSGFSNTSAHSSIQSQLSLAESEAFELEYQIIKNESQARELNERITAAAHEIDQLKVYSPISGKIMNMTIAEPGLSISAGNQVMEIVPNGGGVEIDVRIPVNYATTIERGMTVDIFFPTIPGSSTQRLKGTLTYLSADRNTDPRTNEIYLEGRVTLKESTQINGMDLRPGLPATVMLDTGPRTLLSYIVRPLTDRIENGLQ